MLKKSRKFLKIECRVSEESLDDILTVLGNQESVTWFKSEKEWIIEVYNEDKLSINFLTRLIKKKFKVDTFIKFIPEDNWLNIKKEIDEPVFSNLFQISQVRKKKIKCFRKFYLKIPDSTSFGSGAHESTFLMIKAIENLYKYKKFKKFLDLGTGSGILGLVINKLFKEKIIASDYDKNSRENTKRNSILNHINNIHFIKSYDFKHKEFINKRFDLILANLLLKPLTKLPKYFSKYLSYNGYLILSGVLEKQVNELYSYYYLFNFRLKKKYIVNNWAVLVFKKYGTN